MTSSHIFLSGHVPNGIARDQPAAAVQTALDLKKFMAAG
jgi:hypothetical protein